ncbi:unnamed protein product, partial [Didymodactylos carnosus]
MISGLLSVREDNTTTEVSCHNLTYTVKLHHKYLASRDICDGVQQCMSSLDEENCDKLEFNECEDDEYRCINGMCIPDQYFLDGDYDCLDLTDEKGHFDDGMCTFQQASYECDDRL